MKRQGSIPTGRVLAAAAIAAAMAMTILPAHAAPPLEGTVAFDGAYAADGFINAAEAAAADPAGRPVIWTASLVGDPAVSAEGRFTDATDTIIPGGNCGPFNLGPNGSGTQGYLNSSCMAAAPQGEIRWQVRWQNADGISNWVSDSIIVDTIAPTVTITKPANASINPVVVKSTGARVLTIAGTTTEPNLSVSVSEANEGLLFTTTSDASGNWSREVQLPSGTYSIQASAADAAGNTALSNTVVFDLDADLPTASITYPAEPPLPFLPGEPVIIEGVARDTNGQAFGGLLAVEVNIHDPTIAGVDPSGTRGNILGYVELGRVIHQQNANCQPTSACPASGVTQVSWKYDATWLPAGTYTLQILPHDRAGNEAVQPATVRIVKL